MQVDIFDTIKEAIFSMEVTTWSAVIKLGVSFVLGALIGFERQVRRRSAGIRTFSLISMGATAAMLISIWIPQSYPNFLNGDPGRIAAQILTGIGFLGAGAIIQSKGSVHGLTTAAAIWVAAIIGMCVGCGMYVPAVALSLLSIFVLLALDRVERNRTLSGDVKVLQIYFSSDTPNIEEVENILKQRKIFIFSVAVEKDFSSHSALLTFRIQADPLSSMDDVFDEIYKLDSISKIHLDIL